MTPPPRTREKLTGRTRGRPRMFSRSLTLQVEVKIEKIEAFCFPAPPPPTCEDRQAWRTSEAARVESRWEFVCHAWRDATWEDQYSLQSCS